MRRGLILACCGALLVSGCATKEQTGMAGGAAAGALAGSAVGGRYQGLAIVGGALVGALVGGLIGKALDEADQRKAQQAAASAAHDGRRIIWSSDKTPGVRGYAEPVGPAYTLPTPSATEHAPSGQPAAAPPAPQAASAAPATQCRKVREVVIIDGTEKQEEAQYCLRGGAWARA